eukprot:scaffold3158_cov47-Cyclotella_meneghiniana.AAC.3
MAMAGSLQIAAQTLPNPTTTITNVSATGVGGGGVDSVATAVASRNHRRGCPRTNGEQKRANYLSGNLHLTSNFAR